MKKQLALFISISLILISNLTELQAYPRFAAFTGDKCIDCHVNPTGGLMRNTAGIEGAKKFLNMEMFKKIAGKMEFSPQITKDISIGGDVRLVAADHQVPSETNFNTFLTMQGDIYLNAQLNKILNVFITSGMEIPNFPTKYEVWGLLSNLPAGLWFKVGRMTPNFGLRIPEHRAYQRQILWNAPYSQDDGFELGISPDFFNMNVGLFNGQGTNFFDGDSKKMFTGSADFTFSFNDYNYNFNFGGSFFNNPFTRFDPNTSSDNSGNRKAWGGFTKIGIMKRVALLGEVDFEEFRDAFTPLRRGMYAFGELNVRVIQGVELRGQYERYDRDRDIVDNEVTRISAGATFFPFFGLETEIFVRFVKEEPEVDNDEMQWTFHFYF